MMRKITAGLLSLMLVMTLLFATYASGGSASDPLVSKSYVDGTFFQSMIASAEKKVNLAIANLRTKYFEHAETAAGIKISDDIFVEACASAVLDVLQSKGKYLYSSKQMDPVQLASGDVISGDTGTMLIATEGSIKCSSGSVINITQGKEISAGNALGKFTTFMFPESGGKVEIVSKNAKIYLDGKYSISGGYEIKYMEEAYALKALGLVRGAANGMELYRGNTRAESITMLVRMLGEEKQALSVSYTHPFTDVDAWAQKYVGYAYHTGYTKGVTSTRYDGGSLTTAAQYLTFVLRSLGYSEEAGDFRYVSAVSDAVRLGVISASFEAELGNCEFKRDHVMHISYLAMSAKIKGSNMTLLEKLVENGAVDKAAATEFLNR